jgi:pantoate--beta-alanine ligase
MKVVGTFAEARAEHRGVVGLVPTMGALHAGHRSLLDAARSSVDHVVVSIFVNPLQFNEVSDLDRYPRPLDADLEVCAAAGVDVVFHPTVEEMYPRPIRTTVSVSEVVDRMEGPNRPGHFDGVATVVAKLFAGVQPDRAFFGRKDAQQVAVIRTMSADLDFPVEIVPCSTVRDPDGLALSSRNVFLSEDERRRALGLSRGLLAAADAAEAGEVDAAVLVDIARREMGDVDLLEYVALAAQEDAAPLSTLDRPAFLAVAARVGRTRLIDNVAFDLADGVVRPDRGIRRGTVV